MRLTKKEQAELEAKVNAYNAVCQSEQVKEWRELMGEFSSLHRQKGFTQRKRYYKGGMNWIAYIVPPYVELRVDSDGASVTFNGWDGFIEFYGKNGGVEIERTIRLRKGEANLTQERIRQLLEKEIKKQMEKGVLL